MKLKIQIKAGVCAIAASGLFASPAFGAAQPVSELEVKTDSSNQIEPLAPVSDWSVKSRSDRCRLSRNFGSGESATTLWLEQGGADPTFNLTLIGKPVANPVGAVISIRFGPGQEAFGRTYISAKSSKGRSVITLYGTSFAATVANDDGSYTVMEADMAALEQMRFLHIERAGLRPFRLDFNGSLAEPMQELAQCAKALQERLSVASTGESRSAMPATNPGEWVQRKDYPRMMLNYKKEGAVDVRLTVNASGKATFCAIEHSTLPQMFDNSVCLALLRKARFDPALDHTGKPVPSYWYSSVKFQII